MKNLFLVSLFAALAIQSANASAQQHMTPGHTSRVEYDCETTYTTRDRRGECDEGTVMRISSSGAIVTAQHVLRPEDVCIRGGRGNDIDIAGQRVNLCDHRVCRMPGTLATNLTDVSLRAFRSDFVAYLPLGAKLPQFGRFDPSLSGAINTISGARNFSPPDSFTDLSQFVRFPDSFFDTTDAISGSTIVQNGSITAVAVAKGGGYVYFLKLNPEVINCSQTRIAAL